MLTLQFLTLSLVAGALASPHRLRQETATSSDALPTVDPTSFSSVIASASSAVASATSTASASSASGSASPSATTSVATAVPSPTASPDATLPEQAPLPPKQAWCPSEIFCAGELLQTVNLARLYGDSKTFVDKPTDGTSEETLAAFETITASGNVTIGQLTTFVQEEFQGEGQELAPLTLPNFPTNPAFLQAVKDPLLRAFAGVVHQEWNKLIRDTDEEELCTGGRCESSLIPLNHTFVVPGGRFREQYYWDTYWIIQGLLQSELYDIVESSLQNFMDELATIGFIPNGGRIYYLNRSQPPLFIPMLHSYVKATGNTGILQRALPLAEKELTWWETNRTISVTSPYTGKTHRVARYAVVNSAPRPESYREDYLTANGEDIAVPLNESQKSALYAELASGAETGWDYSSRWLIEPLAGGNISDNLPPLRTLNVRNTIPVDLNAILYHARTLLAELYDMSRDGQRHNNGGDRARFHRDTAWGIKSSIKDLFWDKDKLAFYDFNLTANARGTAFTAAHYYPFWVGIIPEEVANSEENAFKAFSSLHFTLSAYNGTLPATYLETGLQWDFPNSWPPHIYIALEALKNLPPNVTRRPIPPAPSNGTTFDLIPPGQLGFTLAQLPPQTLHEGGTIPADQDVNLLDGTVLYGGNATEGEGWAHRLRRELANRYQTSVFCGWYASGGSIPGVLPQLSPAELNATESLGRDGILYEKQSALDIDSAGRGGEYPVQAGFGWTNGVSLWASYHYGDILVAPDCPEILIEPVPSDGSAPTRFRARRRKRSFPKRN